ncbi:MAG TPA: chemotaxis protein CheA, partial [bacterium]|nr:chemotaxis protein CheA [bacterium]
MDYVRNGKIQIDSELVDLLLKNNDNLNNILSQLANSNKITNVNVDIQNKLNKYIENKINPERAENIDFDVDSSYFFETADKNKIKELLASKKNIYEIVFYYKEDFQEQIANFEVLKSKIELFGEVLGLTIAIEKIEDLEQFSYYEDFDLPLNLYFATEESISTIAMLVDKDESKIRKLEETEINKLLSQKDMQRTFGRVKKTKPKPTEKKEKNIIGGEKTVSETPKKEAIASKPQEKTNIIEKPAQKPAPVVTSPQTVSERKETAKQPAANVSTSGGGTNSGASSASVSSSTVRVDIEKLDRLMNLVGELLICKTQVEQIGLSSDLTVAENRSKLKFMTEQLGRVTNDLQEAVMKTRMVPIGTVFNRFPRVVRDIAKNRGKKVNLIIKGEETELDKTVIEEIGDPMVHLIRNAVDHGIEEPEKRRAAGKNETGNLILNAFHEGNHIIIEIEDDGAGINPEVIKRKAIEKGLATEDELKNMPDNEIVKFIFKAGFSTAEKVTDISGRGVGMDVVKSNISKINGIVDINTKVNEGTKFIIKLPLTLAIINSLLVKVADQIFAVPLASVIESVKISASDIGSIEGKYEVIKLRDSVLSVIRLNKVFDISEEENTAKKNKLFVVVIGLAEEKFALIVDELLGQQEIVIKSLNHKIVNTPGIAGATILGDG